MAIHGLLELCTGGILTIGSSIVCGIVVFNNKIGSLVCGSRRNSGREPISTTIVTTGQKHYFNQVSINSSLDHDASRKSWIIRGNLMK